ncbi:MAG: CHASE3 domain-containing protein [Chitinophagales bacterium]|nr:CHASE3 domain-containing protein [Chitinophagales bacterium]
MAIYKTLFADLTKDKYSLIRRVLIAFLFVLTVINVIIFLSWDSFNKMEANEKMVQHTHLALRNFEILRSNLIDAETNYRGFLITGDTSFMSAFKASRDSMEHRVKQLDTIVSDNPRQLLLLDTLKKDIQKRVNAFSQSLDQETSQASSKESYAIIYQSQRLLDQMGAIIDSAEKEENVLMKQRNKEQEAATHQTRITIIIFTIMVLSILLVALVTIISELNKRAALEELLKSVLDASPSGIQSFQSLRNHTGKIIDFRLLQANKTSYDLLPSLPRALEGKTMLQLYPENLKDGLFDKYVNVVETGVPINIEHSSQSEKRKKWYHIIGAKLGDGFTITITNITESKKMKNDLENSMNALRRNNKELEQFAYVASHDLQEPLRKILAFIDRLRSKALSSLNEESISYMDRISIAADRMRTLINDLLTYSRSGKEEAELKEINLNVLLPQILSDLEVIIQQKQATITLESLPVLDAIETQMRQLFQNLIINAIKFSSPNRLVKVLIRSEYLKSITGNIITKDQLNNDSSCRIYVEDNGIGFNNQYAQKIFQLFQRLHGRSEYEGTGIGLAICKKIVSLHHGTIVAEGKPGEGAVFIITLPLHHLVSSEAISHMEETSDLNG